MIVIREAKTEDFQHIWPFFREIVSAGTTYSIDRDISYTDALSMWMRRSAKTFVAVDGDGEDGVIVGTYKLAKNREGPGDHIANGGYMVSPKAQGRGIATMMCEHSQEQAQALGFKAMQYNAVVESNKGAVSLWQKMGFTIVGTIPRAFNHAELGYVGVHVMYKWLDGAT
ncbi:MAG: GNAT family N-acetyltransferase [Kordiimonadaceae bacterium]|nr:GNAT family N-acetyltransferase [Kordiimonadaceae bacterium]